MDVAARSDCEVSRKKNIKEKQAQLWEVRIAKKAMLRARCVNDISININ